MVLGYALPAEKPAAGNASRRGLTAGMVAATRVEEAAHGADPTCGGVVVSGTAAP